MRRKIRKGSCASKLDCVSWIRSYHKIAVFLTDDQTKRLKELAGFRKVKNSFCIIFEFKKTIIKKFTLEFHANNTYVKFKVEIVIIE